MATDDGSNKLPPMLLSLRSHPTFITWSVAIAVFTDVILYGVIIPVFPVTLEQRAHVAPEDVQKLLSISLAIYGGGIFIGAPLFGYIADKHQNRRYPLLGGLIILLFSTMLLWFGSTANMLIIGRFFQGVACSCVWSVGLALIVDSVEKEDVGRSMGFVMIWLSVGFVMGPTIGGVIYDRFGYDAVFIVSIGMVFVDIVLRLLLIERKDAVRYYHEYLSSSNNGCNDPERQPLIVQVKQPTHVAAALQHNDEEKSSSVIPPFLTLLISKRILLALLSSMIVALVLTSFEATLAIQLHKYFNYTPSASGFMFVTLVLPSIAGPWIGHLCDLYGARWMVSLGFLITVPCLMLIREPANASTTAQMSIALCLLGIGFGQSLVMTPTMVEIEEGVAEQEALEPERYGEQGAMASGYALFIFAYSTGTLLGPIFAGYMVRTYSWSDLTLALSMISFVVAVLAVIFTGSHKRRQFDGKEQNVDENSTHSVIRVTTMEE